MAKLYCVTSADKTKLNEVYFRVTCAFKLVAIWPITLIGRLRFLFLSLIFWIRICAKAYFCLASPLPSPSPSPAPPPYVPKLRLPYGIVIVEHIFLPRHPTRDENATKDGQCAVREMNGWAKKLCPLLITIRILGVILSNFYSLKISNHWYIKERYSLQKSFSLSRIKH